MRRFAGAPSPLAERKLKQGAPALMLQGCCLIAGETFVHQHLNLNPTILCTPLCGFVRSYRLGFAHRAWSYNMAYRHVACLEQEGNYSLGAFHTQLLVHGGIATVIGVD